MGVCSLSIQMKSIESPRASTTRGSEEAMAGPCAPRRVMIRFPVMNEQDRVGWGRGGVDETTHDRGLAGLDLGAEALDLREQLALGLGGGAGAVAGHLCVAVGG